MSNAGYPKRPGFWRIKASQPPFTPAFLVLFITGALLA